MARIRSVDTKPELLLRRALWRQGLRGWRLHAGTLPGKPDIIFASARLAVFVDGAFWHGHPSRFRYGASGEYWDRKIRGNVERDKRTRAALRRAGWATIRVWDFQVLRAPNEAAVRVRRRLEGRPGYLASFGARTSFAPASAASQNRPTRRSTDARKSRIAPASTARSGAASKA